MDGALLILSREHAARLMTPADYLGAVEAAFVAVHEGRAASPPPMHMSGRRGGFHAKAAMFDDGARSYAALKLNANFPGNVELYALPTIQGVILLFDAETGVPLALIDSIEVTLRRTAAASALAARHLARKDSRSIAICGCGAQARAHVEALAGVLPLSRGAAWDQDPTRAESLARFARDAAGLRLEVANSLRDATLGAAVIVTCTTATTPFLGPDDVSAGAFVAAIGADAPHKSEIDPRLMGAASVFVDVAEQCVEMGDLRHAIEAGAMQAADIRGDLAALVSARAPGRTHDEERIVFDSTGTGLQDAACAAMLYSRARERGIGAAVKIA